MFSDSDKNYNFRDFALTFVNTSLLLKIDFRVWYFRTPQGSSKKNEL
ncbi:hypothetical protein LEP1GSC040_3341 [Leptospira santarosai str. 2000030832]|nr:hypothetical protein LEP1GSC040_3341 [Leptospira santarosai str. 2000030832]